MNDRKALWFSWVLFPLLIFAAEDETALAESRAAAVQTLRTSLGALRSTYTADIEFESPELGELEIRPSISYKQRVFEDGTGELQADLNHIPLPEEAPGALREISFGFLHTAEGSGLRLDNEAIQRDGHDGMDDPFAQLLNTLNDIPMPSDEELAEMDLRQETEVVDGVECQLITWIDENYNPDDPTSIAMHCVAFGTDDHLLRSYMALDSGGESRFALRFKNINTNPSFGPDDFTFGPDVRVTHVKTDEEFGIELQKLFMKKMVQAALKPKKKHRRHTNGGQGEAIPPPEESPESIPEPEAPAEVSRWRLTGRWAFCAGVLIALGVVAIMYWLQKRKHS